MTSSVTRSEHTSLFIQQRQQQQQHNNNASTTTYIRRHIYTHFSYTETVNAMDFIVYVLFNIRSIALNKS